MSLIDLYINDGGNIRRIGDNPHDMLMIWKGELWYHNLQNGDGCKLGEESEWYSFVENADEYGYNCDPRKDKPQTCGNCKHRNTYSDMCRTCGDSNWEPKDEPQTELCRDCEDYAGNGMFCAKNYMVYDFSRSVCKDEATISKMEQVEVEPQTEREVE